MKKDTVSLLILVMLCFGLPALLFQCKKNTAAASNSSGPAQAANEVWIDDMVFNPAQLTVAVNTTVKWNNRDGTAHTVTSTGGHFDSGNIGAGGTYSHAFTTAGTYPYKCNYHSSMTGTVVVQ